jgi:hypothetical protein
VALPESDLGRDQSVLWQEELNKLKLHIIQNTKEHKAEVEAKLSMLSIQTATRFDKGGKPLLFTKDGEPVTEKWTKREIEQFIKNTKRTVNRKINKILHRLKKDIPEMEEFITKLSPAGPDGISGSPDDIPESILEDLQKLFHDSESKYTTEYNEYKNELKILDVMDKKLVAKFNATAGYIDIFHEDLNKYSSLIRQLKRDGLEPSEMVVSHIGDSITDKIPTENTGPDEVNDGADEVFLLGVQNSSQELRDLIRLRRKGNQHKRGDITARREVLGVTDILLSINHVIKASTPAGI